MSTSISEVTRLTRRVGEQDETIRAISDTVIDIKETVDGHTAELRRHSTVLRQHTAELHDIKETVDGHTAELHDIKETQGEHTLVLHEILRRLDDR
ncbi:MAG: hypothetical protein ACRDPW_09945 [Mycobacteriales bacterium]